MLADGAKMKSTKKDEKGGKADEKPRKMTGKELRDYFNNRRAQMKK